MSDHYLLNQSLEIDYITIAKRCRNLLNNLVGAAATRKKMVAIMDVERVCI